MSRTTKWLIIWCCWTFVALFFTAEVVARGGSIFPITNLELFIRNLISAYLWFALTPLVVFLTRRFPITYASWRSSVIVHVLAGGLISVFHVATFTFILQTAGLIVLQGCYFERFQRILAFNFNTNLAFYLLVLGITLAIDAYLRRKHAERDRGAESLPAVSPGALERAAPALDEIPALSGAVGRDKLTRIPIKGSGRITFVEIHDIDYLEADDNYVRVHAGNKSHLIREKIGRLEVELDASEFIRIHRSVIVNTRRIKELRPMPGSIFEVVLADGRIVRSGRSYRENFASLLGE